MEVLAAGHEFSQKQVLTHQTPGFKVIGCHAEDLGLKTMDETPIVLVRWKLRDHME